MNAAQLIDADGAPVPYLDGRWRVEESRRYELRVGERCAARLNELPLDWQPAVGGFVLQLPFAVGQYAVELERGALRHRYALEVAPAEAKLAPSQWEAMLADLDAWVPGLLAGAEGATDGSVQTDGVATSFAAVALIPLLPAFERAVHGVLARPRTLDHSFLDDVPLHQTRRADRESLAWFARHPEVAQWLRVDSEEALVGAPPVVPQRMVEDTRDHPANRYVAWLVRQVARTLRGVAARLELVPDGDLNETRAWALARAGVLSGGAERLDRLVDRSFLRALPARPATEAALLVVADHPAYARVHRLGRRFLSALYATHGDGLAAPTRPSFELYELWSFLAVQRVLDRAIPGGVQWQARGLGRLLRLNPSHSHARVSCTWAGRPLTVWFNPSFPSVLGGVPEHGRWSVSTLRRPDIAVTLGGAAPRWVCLDAKYRAGRANLGDALSKAHIYRDALRWDAHGGRCAASVLLAPKRADAAALWFESSFLAEHEVGIWELRPGLPPPAALGDWLLHTLTATKDTA